MDIEILRELMLVGDVNKTISTITAICDVQEITEILKQIDPLQHNILSEDPITGRPDKNIYDDRENLIDKVVVNRIPIGLQKKIVISAVSFLGIPTLSHTTNTPDEETLVNAIKRIWDRNKLDYSFRTLAKKTMIYTQCAELWYPTLLEEGDKYWEGTGVDGNFKLSMKILSPDKGDTLLPIFDNYGDMIAFARIYKLKNHLSKEIEYFELYTAEEIFYCKRDSDTGNWLYRNTEKEYFDQITPIPNIFGKIPIIYYSQPTTEWADVEPLIQRLEIIASNLADTNDYSGSPLLVATGPIKSMPKKGDQGKIVEVEGGADLRYLQPTNASESIRMEIDNLFRLIFYLTHTPELTTETMKGFGMFSGIALKMLFLDAHLKAMDKEEIFGECIQRRINFLKTALSNIDVKLETALSFEIKPIFTPFLPKNVVEELDNIIKAKDAGLLSDETSIQMNPLLLDWESEIKKIEKEISDTEEEIV